MNAAAGWGQKFEELGHTLPAAEPEIIAEAFVHRWMNQPELLVAIEHVIARYRAMGLLHTRVHSPTRRRPIDARVDAKEIRVILTSLLRPEYKDRPYRELWMSMLARHQQQHPDLVQKIQARIEHTIPKEPNAIQTILRKKAVGPR